MNRAMLIVIVLAAAGCTDPGPDGTDGDEGHTEGENEGGSTPGARPVLAFDACDYQEALSVVDQAAVQSWLPAGYTATHSPPAPEGTAILFVAYSGCSEGQTTHQLVQFGVTVDPPPGTPGPDILTAYILGNFVPDEADRPMRSALVGPVANATIAWGPATLGMVGLDVMSDQGDLRMRTVDGPRVEGGMSGPFSIRMVHDGEGGQEVAVLNITDLERRGGEGTFDSEDLFGRTLPSGVTTLYVGHEQGFHLQRIL